MEHGFVGKVRQKMKAFDLPSGTHIMVGVSGGIDSMVLLHVLRQMDYRVSVAHVNFQLRGMESAGDADFVKAYCNQHDISFYLKEINTSVYTTETGLNIQSAARQIRYDWWQELHARGEMDVFATAHHLDDQIETFFIQLLRGTGMKGLTGIPPKRDFYIRPMLGIPRPHIEEYAEICQVPFRQDSSNEKLDYLRNKIRHQLVPLLKELSPGFEARMEHSLQRIGEEWDVWEKFQENWIAEHMIKEQRGYHVRMDPGDEPFLLRWLEDHGIPWNLGHDFLHADSIQSGQVLHHHDLVLSRTRMGYFLEKSASPGQIVIASEGEYAIDDINISIRRCELNGPPVATSPGQIFIPVGIMQFPLTLRTHRPGDTFQPMGMQGHSKKIQDLLVDRKVEVHEKSKVFVLENGDHILWVVGIQPDERTRVSDGEKEVFEVKVVPRKG
jgi:tRNA(Ile)-lysidine synthase